MLLVPAIILPSASGPPWFTSVVDRINMLPYAGTTGYAGTQGNGAYTDAFISGPDYTFTPPGGEWGTGYQTNSITITPAATIAPDGTLSGQKLVGTTFNGNHYLQSPGVSRASTATIQFRFAFYAKAAEYSRVELQFSDFIANAAGAVFDLVGVQTGPTATVGTGYTINASGISAKGNGWCLCYIDATIAGSRPLTTATLLDNGSGTGAISNSFAGDGTSGIYVWRANILPTAAWNLTGTKQFFDDFTSLNGFDLSDTMAPGFNWYLHNAWPNQLPINDGWPSFTATPSGNLSITGGTYLTLINDVHSGLQVATAATNGGSGPGAYVGQVFTISALFETKMNTDPSLATGGAVGWPIFWSWAVEMNTGQNPAHGVEFDFVEFLPTGAGTVNLGGGSNDWASASPTGIDPHGGVPVGTTPRPIYTVDHRFNTLILTQAANGGTWGWRGNFVDGVFVNGADLAYSSSTDTDPSVGEVGAFSVADSQHFFLILGGGAGSWPGNFDYVALYK